MIAVLAAFGLGVAVVGPSYALWARRRLCRAPGVFRCRMRPVGPREGAGWQPTRRYAVWVHDVLVVHRGPALGRSVALGVTSVTGPTVGIAVRGFGEQAVGLRLFLDDGRLFDVAVRNGDVTRAIGPFVVAALQ